MKKNFFLHSLPFRLLVGVAFGICIGLLLNIIDESAITTAVLNVVVTSKYILGQLISFSVPLIIIGFIAPSITRLGNNASRMLGVAVSIAYASSLGAALFSALSGYLLIPHLSFSSTASHLKALPDVVFELSIPQIMPVMSALVLAIMLGLASAWTKASLISSFLEEFQKIILAIVSRVIIPILPYFIGLTFCSLAYEGTITRQFLHTLKCCIYKNTYRDNVRIKFCSKFSHQCTCNISAALRKFYDKSAVVRFCFIYIGNVFRAFQTTDFDFGSLLLFSGHILSSQIIFDLSA